MEPFETKSREQLMAEAVEALAALMDTLPADGTRSERRAGCLLTTAAGQIALAADELGLL